MSYAVVGPLSSISSESNGKSDRYHGWQMQPSSLLLYGIEIFF